MAVDTLAPATNVVEDAPALPEGTSNVSVQNKQPSPSPGHLRPGWKPGQSGNPGGRPVVAREFREKARDWCTEEGWPLLLNIARGSKYPADRIRALELIFGYAYGKPSQRIEGEVNVRGVHIVLPGRTLLAGTVSESHELEPLEATVSEPDLPPSS